VHGEGQDVRASREGDAVTTSKPIQIPQGYSWERFRHGAQPLDETDPMMTIPPRMRIAVMTLNGVRSFPLA